MEPRTKGRRMRADTVSIWWGSLNERDSQVPRATRLLPASLLLAAVAAVASMPLPWHHLMVPAQVYSGPLTVEVIHGLDTANWLFGVAVVAVALAVRTYLAPPSIAVKWILITLAFVTVSGMVIDYFDWSLRGVSVTVKPYYGPGFFLALCAAPLTVVATLLAWRVPD